MCIDCFFIDILQEKKKTNTKIYCTISQLYGVIYICDSARVVCVGNFLID